MCEDVKIKNAVQERASRPGITWDYEPTDRVRGVSRRCWKWLSSVGGYGGIVHTEWIERDSRGYCGIIDLKAESKRQLKDRLESQRN